MFGRRTFARTAVSLVAILSGSLIAAAAPAPPPAATRPAGGAPDVAGPDVAGPAEAPEAGEVRFQFERASYRDLIGFASRMMDKPLMGEREGLSGTLTYFDAKPYTRREAMSIINELLRLKGYTLIDAGRYLKLVPLAKIAQQEDLPVIQRGLDEQPAPADEEIVTTILQLQYLDASQATALVARMVHSFGTLSTMGQGKGIIVTDTAGNIRRIQRLLQAIDTGTSAKQQLKYYPLKQAPASSVAKLIDQLFGAPQRGKRKYVFNSASGRYEPVPVQPVDTVTVSTDQRSNTVVVIASPEKHIMIEELIAKIDVPEKAEAGTVRAFELKNANAEEIAKSLNAAVGTKTITVFDARGRKRTRQEQVARIVADASTNRVIVSGDLDILKRVEQLIEELDAAAAAGSGMRIFPLKVAGASSLATVLQNTFTRRDRRGRPVQTFSVVADQRTNSLVVRAPAAEMEEIARLIEQLDGKATTQREFHVVRLPAGDARQVAQGLTRLLSRQTGRRGRSDQTVRVEADRGTNSLLIAAPPGEWQEIQKLLEQLTREVETEAISMRIFALKHARAPELSGVLGRIFKPRGRGARGGRPEPPAPVITHDAQSNAVLVSATAEDLAEIDRLITSLDTPAQEAGRVQVRSYALANASAQELARSLTRLFRGRRGRGEEPEPRFEAERNSNQIVVAATEEQFETIDQLVRRVQADAGAGETSVRLFPLTHARAEELAGTLKQVVQAEIAAAQRRGAARGRRSDFQVSVDKRTNSLLITAPAATMAVIEQLMDKLDAEGPAATTTRVIELTNADAKELADALNAALAGQAPRGRGRADLSALAGRRVVVVPEPSARAVLLTGSAEDVAFAEELIAKIDARPAGDKLTVRTFPIRHGRAEDIAEVLNATVGRTGRRRGAAETRISADKGANAVVVSATGEIMEQVEAVLKQIDVQGAGEGAVTIEIVPLTNAKAEQLAAAMNAAQGADRRSRGRRRRDDAQDAVRVTADPASNSLLLTGRPAQIEEAKALISQLDRGSAELTSQMRVFQLTHARAAELAAVLEKVLIGPSRSRRGRDGADIRIAAQEQANAVVVQAPPDAIALAEQIVKQFDGEAAAEIVIQVVKLSKADATTLADAVNRALAERATRRRGRPAPAAGAVVVAEVNSNSVLVRGNKVDVERAIALIRQLDAEGAGVGAQVRVFGLKHADASQVAGTVDALFRQVVRQQQRRAGRGGSAPAFSIAADDRTNSVIVSADPANFATVESLLTKLDTDAEGAFREVRYIPLLHADAVDVVDQIDAMFLDRKKADRPTVTADELANGLTVIARDADFRAIDTVVAKLDEAAEANYITVRVIPLSRQVRAEKLAEMLKRLYEQVSGSEVQITDKLPPRAQPEGMFMLPAPADAPAAAPPATRPTGAPAMPADPAARAPADQPPVVIAVDKDSNSLIVSAGRKEITEIELLIEQLTSTELTGEEELKVFKVRNADPSAVAKTLTTLFNPKPVRTPQPARGRQRAQPVQVPKPTITVAADARTRSLVVRAKPAELALIEPLIEQLDQAPTVISDVRIFPLKNTDAEEVARNIRDLFTAAGPSLELPKGQKAPKAQELIRQMLRMRQERGLSEVDPSMGLTISANKTTNSVIVAAQRDAMALVAKLIEELDQAPAARSVAVKMFHLQHAEVADVVEAVTRLFASRATGRRAAPGAQVPARVAGNEAARMVIVSARVDELALVEEVIHELDRAGAADSMAVKVYPLTEGDARSVASALTQTLTQGGGRRGRQAAGGSVRISAETGSNAVVVRAAQADHERIARLIREMDQPTGGGAQFRTIRLDRADARQVAGALNSLLRSWPRRRNEPRPTVAFDTKTNTLMVSGTEAHIATVEKMVAELESGKKEAVEVRLLPLSNAQAGEIARALGSFYGPRAAAGTDPSQRAVTVAADGRTNTLIISASPGQFDAITQLVKKLDEAGAGDKGVVKVYALDKGDARSITNALNQTLAQAARRRGSAAEQVYISADTGSNAVVVRAPEDEQERIAQLIREMDKGAEDTEATFRTFKLARADAREMVNALNRMLWAWPRKRGAPRPTVAHDSRTNTLMVSGAKEHMDLIERMIADVEAGEAEEKVRVQLIQLENARAEEVARSLGAFFGPRAQSAADPADKAVTLTADERSNALLVSAAPKQLERLSALVGKLDVADPAGEQRKVVIPLTHAPAQAVAAAITRAFAPQRGQRVSPADLVVAAGEPATNTLIVSASEKNLEKVRALVKEIDTETTGARKVEFMILGNARATDLARVLTQVFRGGRRRGGEEPPSVSADASTNALIMSGKPSDLDLLMAMARQLDQAAVGKTTEVHILPLTNADAVSVAEMVSRLYRESYNAARRAGQSVEPVAVSADADANALVVAASEEAYEAISKLVNQIDEMSPGKANLRLIQLKNADPEDVLKAIQTIYGSGGAGRIRRTGRGARPRGGGGKPEASVLAGQRALLVNASEEDWAVIQKIVEAMDAAAEKTRPEVLVFPLTKAPNTRVAQALNAMYRQAARPNHPEDRVAVTPLAGTNAVVVTAAKDKMNDVAALIRQLDGVDIAGEMQFRVFQLTNGSAVKVLPVLQQMVRPIQQARPNQPINLTADQRVNAIIVSTQAPVLDEIGRIIKTLDAVPPFKTADILVVPLKNADAPSLAAVLTDMLTPGTSRILTPEARALQEQVRLLRLQQGNDKLGPLDLTKPIKITSDPQRRGLPGSNSLIVSSTPENLSAMADIVGLLDKLPIAEAVKLQVVHLKNSDALSVMQLLREVFAQGRRLAGAPGTPAAGRARPETAVGAALTGGLNVTADARTNALIMAGSEEALALAALIVADLDRQPASEFTEVKVFKLTHADAERLAALIRAVFAEQTTAAPGVAGARAYVTKLRMLRQKKEPLQARVARSHPTMVVQADRNANLLVVAARTDLLPIVGELVDKMDVPQAGSLSVVRIYPLKNADASRMATVIGGLFTGANAALIRPEDKPTVTVDTRTNSLVISASEKTYAVVDALLAKLDAKLPIDLRDIRLVRLANADATELATVLQRMMDARVQRQASLGVKDAEALRMVLLADARSNSLIVGGSAEGFKLVEDLARRLDEAAPALSGQIQLLPLKNANAGTLSATLSNLFDRRYEAARTAEVRRQRPVILPDLRTNILLVAANQDDSRVITSLVDKLDARPVDPAVQLVVLPLKFNDAGVVGPVIQRIFADRLRSMTPPGQQVAPQDVVSVETDPLSNALVVSASKENLELIRGLLAKVDVEPPTDTGVVKLYPLRHADASRVASMLQSLVQQGLYKPGLVAARDNAIARAREKVAITTDVRTNALIVSASKENFAVFDQIIRSVDVKEGWGLAGNIKLYLLKHADASQLGPTLQQMFDRKRAAETATGGEPRSLPVVIIPDARTNALLVAGSKEHMDELDALLAKLDVGEVVPSYAFRIFFLKQASATSLEPTLRQLFSQRARPGQPAASVTIIADPKLNALLIGATRDDLALAEKLIAQLDTAKPVPGQVVRAFAIVKADAAQLAGTLRQLYDATAPTGGKSGITVTVDERTNTLLVSAAPADMAKVEELVRKLDTAPVTDVTEIRIFSLRHADAAQLAGILADALTNKAKALTGVSPNRATLLRFVTESADGRKLIDSALKDRVMVTAVPRTNALLVQAPVEAMPLLARLINALDNTDPRLAEIRVFTLTNADATQMAAVLSELFKLQVANTQRQAARYTVVASPTGAGEELAPPAAAATLGSAEQTALSITVDRRTNSLLVGGTREYVDLVGRVIQQLDASPAEDRQTLVYRLRNAQAADIEAALRQFLDQERQRLVQTLGADAMGAAKELLAREIAIVAEQSSNTMLISGSPRFFKTVLQMIRELDQPPPQVLVQVLLAEVSLDDTTEFGVQWSLVGHPSDGRSVGGGPQWGLKAGGAFDFTVSSGDFEFLLRALQTQGRLEVLSRPQILAADNQEARINIGQRVPFVTASRITEAGTTLNTIEYEDVGIILNVTPHISPDGFVKMEVNPEISSLADSTVEISEGLNAIVVNSRSANTTVTIQDGHTIVIGGLITNKLQNIEEKVPLLGDMPLLGLLFKSTKVVKERSELLIILTPRVLRTPTDGDVLSNTQIRKLGLAKGIHADAAIGELLNPLRDVTPLEVKQLQLGQERPDDETAPVIIPLVLPADGPRREDDVRP